MTSTIKTIFINDCLGSGSFGNVYGVTDEEGNDYALKQCKVGLKEGIQGLMEPSIMSSIIHPSINNSLDIYCSANQIHILTSRANSDIGHYVRKNNVSIPTRIRWCYQLATAVAVLHSQGIIHCDIKSGNVLLFDNDVKLTDFSLALKKVKKDQKFTHSVGTLTHIPLECLLGESWDEMLDIWGLGCTFFEIMYSKCLFPYQGEFGKHEQEEGRINSKQIRIRKKRRTANCIMNWGNDVFGSEYYKLWDLQYKKYSLPSGFPKTLIDDLIKKMLAVEAKDRLNITEVVNYPVFKEYRDVSYDQFHIIMPSTCGKEEISEIDMIEVETMIDEIKDIVHKYVIKRALKLYKRTYTLEGMSNDIKFKTCMVIANKILNGQQYVDKLDDVILDAERKICHYLSFRLHV